MKVEIQIIDAGGGRVQRGSSMTTNMHVDPSTVDLSKVEEENKAAEEEDVPEGAVRFALSAREIEEAMLEPSVAVPPPPPPFQLCNPPPKCKKSHVNQTLGLDQKAILDNLL